MDSMLSIRKVRSSDDSFFNKAMAIYEASFPAIQRQPLDRVKERLDDGRYRLFVGQNRGDAVLMAMFWPLEGADFILFDYLAVAKDHRGMGFGKEFIKAIPGLLGTDRPLVLEVEDPARSQDKTGSARRVKFYERLGARTLKGVRYMLQPPLAPVPTDMVLMVMYCPKDDQMKGSAVKTLIRSIYKELYDRGPRDPLLLSFIDKVPRIVKLI